MFRKVVEYIKEQEMIKQGDRIVAGVSGGADSVCLFYVLLELRSVFDLELYVVHVNHGLRGVEADQDQAFVKELCEANGVSFTSVYKNIAQISTEEGLTTEEAGRKVRYEEFYKCFYENKCNKIAIAHNKNDNAETILFHLFRGSGIRGLTGIKSVRDEIIRPLLDITRAEIEEYLAGKEADYREDASNFTMDYARNRIRLGILPLATNTINNKVVEHITGAGNQLAEIEAYIDQMTQIAFKRLVRKGPKGYSFQVNEFALEDIVIKKGLIREIMSRLMKGLKDLEAVHIDLILELCEKNTGKFLHLPGGMIARRGYDTLELYVSPRDTEKEEKIIIGEQVLNVPGIHVLSDSNIILSTKLIKYKKNMIIPQNGCTKWFDYDKIKNTVLIRQRKSGDFIQINNQGNTKKLKQYFIDEKIPKDTRDSLPLITDGSSIMWILGHRMSEAYKVEEGTKLILEISLDGGTQNE